MGIAIAAMVGGWVVGAIGTMGTIGAGIATAIGTGIGASIVGGCIIGATIGGLSAAVTGGDIGKGMLFGAVGGAALGGLGFAAGNQAMLTNIATASGTSLSAGMEAMEVASIASQAAAGTTTSGLGMGTATAAFGVKDAIGYVIDYKAGEEAEELTRDKMEADMAALDKKIASQERIAAQAQKGGSGDIEAQLAVQRRGQDLTLLTQREQRAAERKTIKESQALDAARLARQQAAARGTVAGTQAAPTRLEGATIDEDLMVADQLVDEKKKKKGMLQGGL